MGNPTNYTVVNASSGPVSIAPDNLPPVVCASGGSFVYSPYPTKTSTIAFSSQKGDVWINLYNVAKDYDSLQIVDVSQGVYTDVTNGTLALGPTTAFPSGASILSFSLIAPVGFVGLSKGVLSQVNGSKYLVGSDSGSAMNWGIIFLIVIISIVVIVTSIIIAKMVSNYNKKKKNPT